MQSSVLLELCLLRGQRQSSVLTLMLGLQGLIPTESQTKKGRLLRDWLPFGERRVPLVGVRILFDLNQRGDGGGTGRNWRM